MHASRSSHISSKGIRICSVFKSLGLKGTGSRV